ncbi:MAG TPA: L-serine ammonia-lyase [Saprospiraceae bacterium]|nr:L-serine ammonia-lyase [Saprospiraceae bacterium]
MESISIFEMIKIGIGPSSSHTMGPWRAAEMFLKEIELGFSLDKVVQVKVNLYGSLAKTGKGHGTDLAVLIGLTGADYTEIDTGTLMDQFNEIKNSSILNLGGKNSIPFVYEEHLVFEMNKSLPFHPNGMSFTAHFPDSEPLERTYYSVGGGFVATEHSNSMNLGAIVTPYPCHKAETIARYCRGMNISVSDLVYLNEEAWRNKEKINSDALNIWNEIKECIFRGVYTRGILPGGLGVKRRAPDMNEKLLGEHVKPDSLEEWIKQIKASSHSFTAVNKWVSCFALAVNEENAAFGRIITAPTNGASGVLPAVLMYAYCFLENFDDEKIIRFILTAGEIGTIFKKNATISAAMGGCQAEIGVSSSMSAAALTECLGGSPEQVLMAAEIAMEHHLGMTCDPVGGLVQIPCIERNSMGAIKAITASNIALDGEPQYARVSLDDVIKTMWETALDMNSKYKETSEGGLAVQLSVNLAEC